MGEGTYNDSVYVLIPAYNCAPHIGQVIARVAKYIPASNIIVVDDGSTDGTGEITAEAGTVVLTNPSNWGKGAALKKGIARFLEGKGKWLITLDGDLQHPPELVPEFLHTVREIGDRGVVIGNRLKKLAGMPMDRRFSNLTTSLLLSIITGVRIRDSQCGYRAISRDAAYGLTDLPGNHYEFETEAVLHWAATGCTFGWVVLEVRYDGQPSSIHRFNDTLLFLRAVLKFIAKRIFDPGGTQS